MFKNIRVKTQLFTIYKNKCLVYHMQKMYIYGMTMDAIYSLQLLLCLSLSRLQIVEAYNMNYERLIQETEAI